MNSKIIEDIFSQSGFIVETKSFIENKDVFVKINDFAKKASITSWLQSKRVSDICASSTTKLVHTTTGSKGSTWIHTLLLPSFIYWNPDFTGQQKRTFFERIIDAMTPQADMNANDTETLQEELDSTIEKLIKTEKALTKSLDDASRTNQVEYEYEVLQQKYDTLAGAYRSLLGETTVADFVEWQADLSTK